MSASPSRSWDIGAHEDISNFFYEDGSVLLQVQSKQFKVSRVRLCAVSLVFKSMLSLSEPEGPPTPVQLHNDPEDFTLFLWLLHFKAYERGSLPLTKFTNALSIAVIAHMYECAEILEWATGEVFAALERRDREFIVIPSLMSKLYGFASRHPHDPTPVVPAAGSTSTAGQRSLLLRTREVWADLVWGSLDPVQWLIAARSLSVQDQHLQAIAYFYILKQGPQTGQNTDPRLTGVDGQRLLIGAYNLNMGRGHRDTAATTITSTRGRGRGGAFTFGVSHAGITGFGSSDATSDGVWQARYDSEIKAKRDQLWELFTDAPWRMVN